MKNRTTILAAAAALALAAALAVLSGCEAHRPAPLISAKPDPVNIQVQVISGRIFVFPNRTHLIEGHQFPVWILNGAADGSCLEVKFEKVDPLEPDPPAAAKEVAAGPCKTILRRGVPKPETYGKLYPYSVTVTLRDGKPIVLDPDIEVDR